MSRLFRVFKAVGTGCRSHSKKPVRVILSAGTGLAALPLRAQATHAGKWFQRYFFRGYTVAR